MGLFSNEPEGEIKELLENANHDSVTEARLTELDSTGLSGRKGVELYDKPLIEYLGEDEQPNYIFFAQTKNVKISREADDASFSLDGNAMYCITDERVLVVLGREEESDVSFSVPFDAIADFECKTARMKHRISLTTDSESVIEELISISDRPADLAEERYSIDLFVVNAFDSEDIDEADRYFKNILQTGEVVSTEGGGSELEYYGKVKNYLDDDEIPEYILRGKTIEIEYGGDDEDKWGKSVYTAVTDKRVLVVIAQRLSGNDTRSIEYHSIDGVNFEKGMINKELQIRAGGATYEIHVLDQSETKEAMKYIRKQMKEAQQSSEKIVSESAPDPTEQLKNLKELHDEGVLSDEEFESKKTELMDKI